MFGLILEYEVILYFKLLDDGREERPTFDVILNVLKRIDAENDYWTHQNQLCNFCICILHFFLCNFPSNFYFFIINLLISSK